MNVVKDLTGKKFGKLKVLKRIEDYDGCDIRAQYLCKCSCGKEMKVVGRNLTRYKRSCMDCRK